MSHYAKVRDGLVQQVIVASEDFFSKFVDSSAGEWIQTSYNTRGGVHYDPKTGQRSADQSKALRKNFAGIGYSYDKARDAFIPPKPYNSWVLNESSCQWEAPKPMPKDGKDYEWIDNIQQWKVLPAK